MKRTTIVAIVIVAIIVVVAGAYAFLAYGPGTLEIQMTDPPTNWGGATQVYINYSAIEVHRADAADNQSGWSTVVSTSGWVNLTQTLSVNKTIGSGGLQAGKYNLIRFSILQAFVTIGGANHTAAVPSGKLQIAITQGGVQISAGQTSRLLIELNIKVEGATSPYTELRIVPDIRAIPI